MHDALVPHSPRDRSIRSAARAALQGILLCTLDYGPRSRVKIWRGKTAKDSETVRVRLLRSHQCRGRCGSLPGLCSGRCMRVARAALGAIEPSLRFHHIVDRQRVTGARRARGAGWPLTAARSDAQDNRVARFTSGSSFRCPATSRGSMNERVCDTTYPPSLPRFSPKGRSQEIGSDSFRVNG